MSVTFADVQAAAARIKGRVIHSPCPPSVPLSVATGMEIFCKLYYLQRTGSFKERGACNALLLLDPEHRKRGVIAASAGNHALALTYHGKLLDIPVTVVMPRLAPLVKVSNCRQMGANVILHGNTYEDARIHATQLAAERGLTLIHGFDDPAVIAGQGTMGLEIVEQVPDLEAVIVPIGGAGLIAGVALAIKTLKPNVTIIGVEPDRATSYVQSLECGHPVPANVKPTLADGLAVSCVGKNAFELARKYVDRTVIVQERDIALAVLRLIELEKAVVEGAGAAPCWQPASQNSYPNSPANASSCRSAAAILTPRFSGEFWSAAWHRTDGSAVFRRPSATGPAASLNSPRLLPTKAQA